MSAPRRRARGQPLVVLMALMLGWIGARVTSSSTEDALSLPEQVLTVGTATAAQAEPQRTAYFAGPQSYFDWSYATPAAYRPAIQYVPVWYGGTPPPAARNRGADSAWRNQDAASAPHLFAEYPPGRLLASERTDGGMPGAGLPPLFTADPRAARAGAPSTILEGQLGQPSTRFARWSMDIWSLMRGGIGGTPPAPGTLPATYGASQAGGVVRYRLAMNDPRRPTAYLRTTSTLGGLSETSLALGLSARPLAAVPVIVAAEGRVTDQAGSRRVQPAVMAVTEMPPVTLPHGLRAEIYAQAGYVAGRYATPFADGQARIDRRVLNVGRYEARVGAGAWGGIQKGASRLDAGPGATVSGPVTSKVFGRLALDWRVRVAGNAEPDSGPALTLGAGF